MTRSPRYVLPTHLCRFAVRAEDALPRGFSGDHGLTRFAQSLRPEPRPVCGPDLPGPRAALHHGDVQNPAEPPQSVAPSVVTVVFRCRNVHLLRFAYGSRPRLSPRLTLGGLASPRKPRVYGGRVTLSSLATHASILTPRKSTVGDPPASPLRGRSPTDDLNHPAASAPSLAPCIVGACPLDQ